MIEDPNELTEDEKAALAALPSEREPGQLLEERTVDALRARGLLRDENVRSSIRGVPRWALGLAASLVFFLGGVATGQWIGTRSLAGTVVAAQQQTAMQTASLVQRTGSAYVSALMALAQIADSSSDPAIAQGKEAALTALHAAARELALVAPDDPLSLLLRDALNRTSLRGQSDTPESNLQSVVWF